MLRSSFLFRGKVPKAKGEDLESDKSTSLEDILVTSSLQKYRARKVSKKSPRKKLKIRPAEPLAFSKINRKKEKVAIITKANREVVVRELWPKQKIKCLYYSKTPVKIIEALDLKKELKGSILFILQQFIIAQQGNRTKVRVLYRIHLQKIAGLLGLDTSVSSINLYLRIHSVSKNYDAIDILWTAKSLYYWFKRDSCPKHANNILRVYAYSGIRPSKY